MIAVDTNILVHAHRRDATSYEQASQVVASLAAGAGAWAIPWPCLTEFYSVVTHPRIFGPPTPVRLAMEQVDAWLESTSLRLLAERDDSWPSLRRLLASSGITGPRVYDAKIAAICLAHGVAELWTADRDFSRFPGIRSRNPLDVAT